MVVVRVVAATPTRLRCTKQQTNSNVIVINNGCECAYVIVINNGCECACACAFDAQMQVRVRLKHREHDSIQLTIEGVSSIG